MTLTTLAIKMQYVIKKKKMLSSEIVNMVYFLLSLFNIKLGGRMTEIFSVRLKKTDKSLKGYLNL